MPKIKEVLPTLLRDVLTSKTMATALSAIGVDQMANGEAVQMFDPNQPVTALSLGIVALRLLLAYATARAAK